MTKHEGLSPRLCSVFTRRKPLHPTLLVLSSLALFAASFSSASAGPRLPRATPESQGVSSTALINWIDAADARIDTMNSFMIVRHGHVIAEGWWAPYQPEDQHILYSITKSFTSTAVGLAVAEGRLSVDDPVVKFFPEHVPANPSEHLKNMRVRDLLTMSTGHHNETIAGFGLNHPEPLPQRFLALTVDHKPGSFFIYNSPGSNMLAAIVQKLTGQTLTEYLRPRLFEPLGIENPRWNMSARGDTDGAGGLNLRTEDIACFGQLYLQRGQWQGTQILPATWIDAATARQTSNGSNPNGDWDQGYGYQFWRCRPGFYRADGAFGQFCFVIPEKDTVIAITSAVRDMQNVMNVVYETILPALGDAKLEAHAAEQERLKQRIAQLAIKSPTKVAATSPQAAQYSGRTYVFPANDRKLESITITVANGATSLVVRGAGYDGQPIVVGHGTWQRNPTPTKFGSDIDPRDRVLTDRQVAAIGGWSRPDTFTTKLCYYEGPYLLDVELQFGGDIVVFNASYNLAFGNNTAYPQLIGRAQ